jgi:hypothetical protein
MNKELIRQLALQASGDSHYLHTHGEPLQKFAMLIAKECAKVARNTDLEDVDGGDSAVLYAASEAIQNYFGVK